MAFDQGASRSPGHNCREKHRNPTKCLAFEMKENTENIVEYRRKKNCFKSFFILIIFLFSAKSGGGGAKKWWDRGPISPSPSAVPDYWRLLSVTNIVCLTHIVNWNIYRASKICRSHYDRPLTALITLDNIFSCNKYTCFFLRSVRIVSGPIFRIFY